MSNDLLMGKPMLILSNKQDLPGSLDALDICDYFEVEYLANLFRTPCYVEGVGRYEQQFDSQVAINACSWLVKSICKNYKSIQNKIRFLRVVTQNESLSSNEEIPRKKNRRPATGKRKVSVKVFLVRRYFGIICWRATIFGSFGCDFHSLRHQDGM